MGIDVKNNNDGVELDGLRNLFVEILKGFDRINEYSLIVLHDSETCEDEYFYLDIGETCDYGSLMDGVMQYIESVVGGDNFSASEIGQRFDLAVLNYGDNFNEIPSIAELDPRDLVVLQVLDQDLLYRDAVEFCVGNYQDNNCFLFDVMKEMHVFKMDEVEVRLSVVGKEKRMIREFVDGIVDGIVDDDFGEEEDCEDDSLLIGSPLLDNKPVGGDDSALRVYMSSFFGENN